MADDNRATLERTIDATFRGDWDTAGKAMDENSVVEWPQSGERIVGKEACLVVYRNYPQPAPEYTIRRISGGPDVFVVEAFGTYGTDSYYLTSIVEFRNGKIVKQTDYWSSPFEAPAWRSQWVQRIEPAAG